VLVAQCWKQHHWYLSQTTPVAMIWHCCCQQLDADWPSSQLLHAAYVPADTAVTSGAPAADGIVAHAKAITDCTAD